MKHDSIVLSHLPKFRLNQFHTLQYHKGNDAAGAAGDGEEGDVEEGPFGGSHEERCNRIGEKAAENGGAHKFSQHRGPQFMGVAVQIARKKCSHHGTRESQETAGAQDISNERRGERRRRTVSGAAKHRQEDIDHVLQRKRLRHS